MKNPLLLAIILILGGSVLAVYYVYNPASSSFFLSCPTYSIFGFYCPGCGSQRALHYFLHGHFSKAFQYNALFAIFFPLSLLYALYGAVYRKWRITLLSKKRRVILALVVVIAYTVVRNLPCQVFKIFRPPI